MLTGGRTLDENFAGAVVREKYTSLFCAGMNSGSCCIFGKILKEEKKFLFCQRGWTGHHKDLKFAFFYKKAKINFKSFQKKQNLVIFLFSLLFWSDKC